MDSIARQLILDKLPLELLKNPNRDTIQTFLMKKVNTFYKWKIAMIIALIIYLVLLFIFESIHLTVKSIAIFDNIFNLVPLIVFLVLAIVFHNLQKKYRVSEQELDAALKEDKS